MEDETMKYAAALAAATLLFTVQAPPTAAPVIVSAEITRDGLVFESPSPLPWDSYVPAHLRRAALTTDAARRARLYADRNDYGHTEVTFARPLPTDLSRRMYYFLGEAGVREIRPVGLLGTARIEWAVDNDTVRNVRAFGHVQARAGTMTGGGFVLTVGEPVHLMTAPSTFSADALLAPHGEPYKGRGTPFRQIVRQYEIRLPPPSHDRWVWVQWLADEALVEGGCTTRLTLFHLGPEPVQVATLDAGCDV